MKQEIEWLEEREEKSTRSAWLIGCIGGREGGRGRGWGGRGQSSVEFVECTFSMHSMPRPLSYASLLTPSVHQLGCRARLMVCHGTSGPHAWSIMTQAGLMPGLSRHKPASCLVCHSTSRPHAWSVTARAGLVPGLSRHKRASCLVCHGTSGPHAWSIMARAGLMPGLSRHKPASCL